MYWLSLTLVGAFVAADQAASAPAATPAQVQAFRAAVENEFADWHAARSESESHRKKPEYDPQSAESRRLNRREEDAYNVFQAKVIEYWPFALGESEERSAAARNAIQYARDFEQKRYVNEGKATRDEAVAVWLSVAQRFPGTVERDEALLRAAHIHIQRLFHGATRDWDKAQQLFAQAANRPGPPTRWSLRAEQNLVSFPKDQTERMRNRSDMYMRVEQLRQVDELKMQVLVLNPSMTPQQFVTEIDCLLRAIDSVQRLTATNMASDARKGPRWEENVRELKGRHAGDPLVEAQGAEKVGSRKGVR